MSITSAMFTGVSGLLANAEGINVIGNNLANVNTVGFKSGRMLFSDMLSANIGNGSQIGRGTQIQKVDNIFSQSSFETTESVTDLAIQGNSFFVVMDPNATAPVNQNGAMLTRAGAFRLDSNFNLVNPDGYLVLDTAGNPIKFSDNATGIATATAALIPVATTAATINTQAAAQLTAAGTFTTAVFTAAATAYNTQAGTVNTAAGTFTTGVFTAAAAAYTAQAGTVKTAADALVVAVGAGTPAEIAAATAIQTDAAAAQAAAATATATPNAANIAAAQAAFATLGATTLANSAALSTNFAADYSTFDTALTAANTQNATDAPPAEITTAIAIQTAATAAQTAATTANTTPNAANVAAAQTAFDTLTTLTNSSTFTPAAFITAYNTFNSALTTANTANATAAAPAEVTAAIAIQTAATAAQTAATAAVTTPSLATNTAAQTAFNALNTLTNNSVFTAPSFVTAYNTFQTGLNTANTAVNTAMTDAATAIANLATAQGLAFSKITSIDPSGLITYLGKDGITTNYYNTSGQVGVAANAANATTVQRLAVMTVANPGGLEKAGGTLFRPTTASGISSTAFSLANNSANGSSEKIYTNSLEQSNVDMAAQFVKMILTQRAYSANSKTITTADEMTQEVLNLKR